MRVFRAEKIDYYEKVLARGLVVCVFESWEEDLFDSSEAKDELWARTLEKWGLEDEEIDFCYGNFVGETLRTGSLLQGEECFYRLKQELTKGEF